MCHIEKEAQIPCRNFARFLAPNTGFSMPNNFASVATESAILPLSLKLVTTLMFAETNVLSDTLPNDLGKLFAVGSTN